MALPAVEDLDSRHVTADHQACRPEVDGILGGGPVSEPAVVFEHAEAGTGDGLVDGAEQALDLGGREVDALGAGGVDGGRDVEVAVFGGLAIGARLDLVLAGQ